MIQEHYNMSVQQDAISTMSREELETAYQRLQMNSEHTIDQLRADRDFWMHDSISKNEQLEQKDQLLEEKSNRANALYKELKWVRDLIYNPSYSSSQKIVAITARDHCRSGKPERVYVGKKAAQVGMARNTYTAGLQALASYGKIICDVKDAKKTGEIEEGGKKKATFETPEEITFTKEFLEDPSILVEKKLKSSGGSQKGKKEALTCQKCGGIHINEKKVYECQDCGEEWTDENTKDANRGRMVRPQDYAKKRQVEQSVLIASPVEQKKLVEDDPFYVPPAICIVCRKPKQTWNEDLATYTCGTDHTVEARR